MDAILIVALCIICFLLGWIIAWRMARDYFTDLNEYELERLLLESEREIKDGKIV